METIKLGESHKLITLLMTKLRKEEGIELSVEFRQPPMKTAITDRYVTVFLVKLLNRGKEMESIFEKKFPISFPEEDYQEELQEKIEKMIEEILEFVLERKLYHGN